MVFLDTCIWIELFAVCAPLNERDKERARVCTKLFGDLLSGQTEIFTCKQQLTEVAMAIQKAKQKEYNKSVKDDEFKKGVGKLKEFREVEEFHLVQNLCKSVIHDILTQSVDKGNVDFDINKVLERIHIADINDCIYYDFCKENNIKLYSIDSDMDCFMDTAIITVLKY